MKKGILIIIGLLFLLSCEQHQIKKESVFQLKKKKTIHLPLANPSKSYVASFQYTVIDGIETMIVYLIDKKLTFYDLKKKKIYHTIDLSWKMLRSFNYLNKDSILLLYYNQYNENGYIDSNLFILKDYNGTTIKQYHFNNPAVWKKFNTVKKKKPFILK